MNEKEERGIIVCSLRYGSPNGQANTAPAQAKGLLAGGTKPQRGANAGEDNLDGGGQQNPAVNYGEAVFYRSTAPVDTVTLATP